MLLLMWSRKTAAWIKPSQATVPVLWQKKKVNRDPSDATGTLYISRSLLSAWWGKMWFVLLTARQKWWEVKTQSCCCCSSGQTDSSMAQGHRKSPADMLPEPPGLLLSAYVEWEGAVGHRNWYWILGDIVVLLLSRCAQFRSLHAGCTPWPPSMVSEWVCPISQDQYKNPALLDDFLSTQGTWCCLCHQSIWSPSGLQHIFSFSSQGIGWSVYHSWKQGMEQSQIANV